MSSLKGKKLKTVLTPRYQMPSLYPQGEAAPEAESAEVAAPEIQAPEASRSREGEQRSERRRRDSDGMVGHRMRLALPPAYRGDKDNEYRWINDDKSRVHDLTKQDDWDIVHTDSKAEGANTVRRQVGTKANGDPLFAHLVRKPKEYCVEDRAKQAASLDETMDQIANTGNRGDTTNIGGEAAYVAADTEIRDGRRKT